MFTGIIEELGKVQSIIHGRNSFQLSITCKTVLDGLKIGDSIAVDGICLTVIQYGNDWLTADVMPETNYKSALKLIHTGQLMNLERALKLGDRLGGHMVSGHIDGTGVISRKKVEDNALRITVEAPEAILKYMVPQGSVAINGVSLTVAAINPDGFQVSLIPLTQNFTNLNSKETGDAVNIECDMIGKYVLSLLGRASPQTSDRLTAEFLKEHGFG